MVKCSAMSICENFRGMVASWHALQKKRKWMDVQYEWKEMVFIQVGW